MLILRPRHRIWGAHRLGSVGSARGASSGRRCNQVDVHEVVTLPGSTCDLRRQIIVVTAMRTMNGGIGMVPKGGAVVAGRTEVLAAVGATKIKTATMPGVGGAMTAIGETTEVKVRGKR